MQAWGVSARTYDTRQRRPGTSTIGELQQLARVLHVSRDELFAVVRAKASRAQTRRTAPPRPYSRIL